MDKLKEFLEKLDKELVERMGVPEHPKAAAKKRRETESEHFGKEEVEAARKTAEKMKGKKEITNPYALSKWMHYGKFAKERKAAGKKAAETRAKE